MPGFGTSASHERTIHASNSAGEARAVTITLPYLFDTGSVWRSVLKGAFALNLVLLSGIVFKLLMSDWLAAIGLVVAEAMVFGFTRLFVRFQTGSVGTLYRDHVELEPNAVLGIPLPGPRGTYARDRFSAVRVEFMAGSINVDGQSNGPHELVWLVGQVGMPDVLLARTDEGAGRAAGVEFGVLLELPVEEKNAPRVIQL